MTSPVARRPLASRALIGLEAGALLVLSSVAVRVLGSARVTRLLGVPGLPGAAPVARPPAEAQRVGIVVTRVARMLPWRPTCLRQALAVRWMLRRRGIASECHLGVFTVAPFAAHAWVTVDGAVVVGGPVTRATRVSTFV
jgi:hypothetical protein